MLRRVLIATVVLALALGASGCAGLPLNSSGDAAEAAALLKDAQEASSNLNSVGFFMTMNVDAAGQNFTMTMHGGAYLKGDQAGDMALQMALNGAGVPANAMQMVLRDDRIYFELNGTWHQLPGKLDLDQLEQADSQIGGLDLVNYVKDVHVESHTTFLGEPVTKIAATISGQDLLKAALGQINSSLGQAGDGSALQIPAGTFDVGDVRIVLYISDETHLMRAAHEDLTITVQGQKAHIVLDMSVVDVNQPVDIPNPSAV